MDLGKVNLRFPNLKKLLISALHLDAGFHFKIMNILKLILLTVLAAACFGLPGCQTAWNSRPDQSQVAVDDRELRQASQDWDKYFNSADAAKLASLYSEEAVSIPPNLPTLHGRKAVRADFEAFFASHTARHETIVERILIDGGMAVESGRYRMTFKPKGGGTEVVETGRHVECRRKIDGKWRIVLEIWNIDTPLPK
jgi:uncharacterized protein (TIGR02246 family)